MQTLGMELSSKYPDGSHSEWSGVGVFRIAKLFCFLLCCCFSQILKLWCCWFSRLPQSYTEGIELGQVEIFSLTKIQPYFLLLQNVVNFQGSKNVGDSFFQCFNSLVEEWIFGGPYFGCFRNAWLWNSFLLKVGGRDVNLLHIHSQLFQPS